MKRLQCVVFGLFIAIWVLAGSAQGQSPSEESPYIALLIGIEEYKELPVLKSPVNDITDIGDVLHHKYGFKVIPLINSGATRENIFSQLEELSKRSEEYNLLIYYAGHGGGKSNDEYSLGYWMPYDAAENKKDRYISGSDLVNHIKFMTKARHILVISDSCYAGKLHSEAVQDNPISGISFFPLSVSTILSKSLLFHFSPEGLSEWFSVGTVNADERLNISQCIQPYTSAYEGKSRWMMTSGNTRVDDADCIKDNKKHSRFACELLQVLELNDNDCLKPDEIKTAIFPKLVSVIRYEPLPYCGHDKTKGGEFVFLNYYNKNKNSSARSPDIKVEKKPIPLESISLENYEMEFVFINPGSFKMGSDPKEAGRDEDEFLSWKILKKGFYIQTTEVTQKQWKLLMENKSFHQKCDDCPVENVNYEEVQEFIKKLNASEKAALRYDNYRLPREEEWEYACRAGTDTPFSFGPCLTTIQANFNGNVVFSNCETGINRQQTVPVKSLLPNKQIYGMHGNVWEWCDTPVGITDKVIRGGSWSTGARACRCAHKAWEDPKRRSFDIGFRLVRDL